jgi:hypothetical protein
MRSTTGLLLTGVCVACAALSACQSTSVAKSDPAGPPAAPSSAAAPILQAVTIREHVSTGYGTFFDYVPDFHFIAPNGNAIMLRRELVATSGAIAQTQIGSATINIPADAQKKGAVISGGWRCGVQQYYVTLRAFVIDADGNRSNAIEYTMHCNGG